MAELTQQERLQPSLLDRLMDDELNIIKEARSQRVLSVRQLREGVIRDLAWLLSTGNLQEVQDIDNYKEVLNSVVNYGTQSLTGITLSSLNTSQIEAIIRQSILTFEPRINSDTVKVKVTANKSNMSVNAVQFEIEGELWAHPIPVQLYMKTDIDLETGGVEIKEDISSRN